MSDPPHILERCQQERLRRVQACLSVSQVDGLLVTDRSLLCWLGQRDVPLLLVTSRDTTVVEPMQAAQQLRGLEHIGFDTGLSAPQLLSLQEGLPTVKWTFFGRELAPLLAVKDGVEVALLRQAARITQLVFTRLGERLEEGVSELDLLHCAYETLLGAGGQGFSFDPSIASGAARTRLIWAGVSQRRLVAGDPVLIDLGISFRGYHCDISRAYLVGGHEADRGGEWCRALRAVEEAFEVVRGTVRPGITGGALHAGAVRVLERAGFAGAMRHALGHGIGQRLHEFPAIAPGSPDLLAPGQVIALEPGVTLAAMGVRREDVFLVTEDGCESLTS